MRTYIFILLMSLLLASSAMPANAIECAHGMPKVAVKRMTKPVEYIRSFTSAGLTQMHTGAYRPDSPGILGLGGGAMEMQTTISFKMKEDAGASCVHVESIQGTFIAHPSVMIAKNYSKGSCEYNAVLAHEKKHIDIMNSYHIKFAAKFKNKLRSIAKDYARARVTTPGHVPDLQIQMQDDIMRQSQAYLAQIMPDLQKAQLKFDSPAEYARVAKLCTNW